jgi:sporulation protein YlmC with PRC-barrel domain
MRLKMLRGLPVIDPTAARRVGMVTDYQVDPNTGRLAALDLSPIGGSENQRVLAERIRRVGNHAVILTAKGGSLPSAPAELNERWLDASTLVGLEVMGEDGTRIGHVLDATFDQDSLAVDAYLLQGENFLDSLIGRGSRIEPEKVHSCSRELMLVNSGAVASADAEESPVASEETKPLVVEAPVPLKDADKLPAPTFEPVADGQPVSSSST